MENGTCYNFGVPEEVLQSFRRLCRDRHKRKRKMDSTTPTTRIICVKINNKLQPLKNPWTYYDACIETEASTGCPYVRICRVQEDISLPAASAFKVTKKVFQMFPITWELSVRHIEGERGVTMSGCPSELEMECDNSVHAAALTYAIQRAIDGDPDNPNKTTPPPPVADTSSGTSSPSSGSITVGKMSWLV